MRGLSRRSVLTALAASALPRGAFARTVPDELAFHDWTFEATRPFVHRAMILAPTHLAPDERVPVLVLLHGLGEAKEGAKTGTFAWLERYGVGSSYARLRKPPLASVEKRHDLTEARAATLNDELALHPFKGLVLVCPFTPNVWSYKSTDGALDALSAFVTGDLLDRVAKEVPSADLARVGIDGCSLGGYVSLELFARRPERYASFGVVQPAIGSRSVEGYADMLARAAAKSPLAVHVESSKGDPYLRVSEELAKALGERKMTPDFIAPPGPHDQPFLRDVGSLEMLLWHDRALRRTA